MATSSLSSLCHVPSSSISVRLYSHSSSWPSRRPHASVFCAHQISKDSKSELEVVYDPRSKFEQLAGDVATPRNLNLFSPCKINVFLRITDKRPDGYHDLASLFHVVSLGDILKFSLSPSTTKDSLTTNVSGIPLDDRNLVIKALNLFRKKTGSDLYYWVHLDKRVPTGAGLGGGSGNAATALWAANRLSGNLVEEKQLQEWSAEIGSDIPFFFSKGAAYCTGRGEIVENVAPLSSDLPMVLMKPKEECSTAEVYKRFRLEKASSAEPRKLLEGIMTRGISQDLCINDLEPPAFEVLPSLKALKERIKLASRGRYQAVFMSGSGSTIVGIGDSEPPSFIYDEDEYQDIFISEAFFLTRNENEWYREISIRSQVDEESTTQMCR
ncbi:hypothetical protein KP509_20G004600 [Ceratopteris richardii]|uniref:4-(cytidine 5'-diphospho)-2-C-methyl-D-erythritol kinase n=1 Tax=Ceratopteris richardii TaxID=49495 RepID=A0A8T2SEP5_CERRI|nr:hypothetical protein KP509_20G004600 [Ceratopteris richardii]